MDGGNGMKKILRRGEKLNNKGVTLIELMVAIAILSIAIIPLMYAFVNSMKYNAKGRELQQTTVLAHTIMEKCKGLTTEEIDDRMDNHTFLDTQTVGASNNSTKTPMTGTTTSWGSSGSLADDGTETYYIGGVQLENHNYDVQMTVSFHERVDLYGGNSKTESVMTYTESMNKYNDAVFTVNTLSDTTIDGAEVSVAGLDFEAYNKALQTISDGIKAKAAENQNITEEVNVPFSYIISALGDDLQVYRYIAINATNDGNSHDIVQVTYTYTFKVDGGEYTYNYQRPDGGASIPLTVNLGVDEIPLYNPSFTIYDNAATMVNGASLDNIFFFYYPAYNGGSTEEPVTEGITNYPITEDIITINNNTGRVINFHMVKQKNPLYSDASLITMEQHNYSPYISANADMIFYHNFDQNLGDPLANISNIHINAPQSVRIMGTLYQPTSEQLMYDIELSIFPAGSYDGSDIISGSEPIITLNGTILDW